MAYTLHGWVVALAYAAADVGTYRVQKCSMRLNDGLSSQFFKFFGRSSQFFGDWVPSRDLGPNGGSVMLVFATFYGTLFGKLKLVVSVADSKAWIWSPGIKLFVWIISALIRIDWRVNFGLGNFLH